MPSTSTPFQHYLLLGRQPDLAFAEGQKVCTQTGYSQLEQTPNPHLAKLSGAGEATVLMRRLGGSIKVLELITDPQTTSIEETIVKTLVEAQSGQFALSQFGNRQNLTAIAMEIKKLLKAAGIKPHFRLHKTVYESAGIGQKYHDFIIDSTVAETTSVYHTIAAQDLAHWSFKDYERPAVDPRSGMLPPKVARIMINLGYNPEQDKSQTLYDPYCGSGTILVEAIDLGLNVIASDISSKAVADSTANVNWFKASTGTKVSSQLFVADAATIKPHQLPIIPDLIVTEGYLGPPRFADTQLDNIVKGMEKMYKGWFKKMAVLQPDHSYLVCALPEFVTKTGVKNLDHLVDWTSTLGYTLHGRYTYAREQAKVRRAIYVLQK
jgi:hypothetical protein